MLSLPHLLHTCWRLGRQTLYRLRHEGVRATLAWLIGRGVPLLTGLPVLRYCEVSPGLFVGGQHGRLGKRALQRGGIQATVNLRAEFDDVAAQLTLTEHCHLPTVDGSAPGDEQLREGIRFIQRLLDGGGKVFVHCHAGIGRAPTLAAAYLIAQGMACGVALDRIRQARPFIELTPAQLECLRQFEQRRRSGIAA